MTRIAVLAAFLWLAIMTGTSGFALQINPLDENTVSVHLTTSGATRDEALLQAKREAVLASAGRVLLNNKLIRADDLLEKYLNNYAPDFVLGVEVIDDKFSAGSTLLNSRVFVDYKKLMADLEEKKFLYTPAYKPQFAVFMQDHLEGEKLEEQIARQSLQAALVALKFKSYMGDISEPPVTADVAADPLLLQAAIISAERRNIEFIVSGESETWLREERKIYYDTFYFYECEMKVKVVRVDTGEIFFETSGRNAASARDQAEAIRLAVERTSNGVGAEINDAYTKFWPQVVQAKVPFEVLLTATDDELTRIISESLKRLGPETKIELKKKFDRSAVLTISTDAGPDELKEVLQSTPYPALRIVRELQDRKFEVQVAG